MRKNTTWIGIIFLMAGFFSIGSAQENVAPVPVSFSDVITAYEQVYGFSGAVKVVNGGRDLLDTVTGYADRSFHVPNSMDTRFSINSISKTFVVTATMLLAEDGRINLSDPISKYISGLEASWAEEITVHHLLSHTSGLPREIGLSPESEMSLVEQLPLIAKATPLFLPGEKYFYSNVGYALLGLIVEEVSGMPYEHFVRDRIIIPAGLEKTGFYRGRQVVENQAVPYRISSKGLEFTQRSKTYGQNPGGGMYSTVGDLYDYIIALEEGRILSPVSIRMVFSPWSESGPGELEAYTWSLKLYNGDTIRLSAGSGYGTKSVIMRIQEHGVYIGITSNFGNLPVLAMLRDLLLTLDGEDVQLPAKDQLARPEAFLARLGTYCFDTEALRANLGIQHPCLELHAVDGRLFLDDELLVNKGDGLVGLSYTDELTIGIKNSTMTITMNGVTLEGIRK